MSQIPPKPWRTSFRYISRRIKAQLLFVAAILGGVASAHSIWQYWLAPQLTAELAIKSLPLVQSPSDTKTKKKQPEKGFWHKIDDAFTSLPPPSNEPFDPWNRDKPGSFP